ncbi:hypothetical protein Aco04nite_10960 [Winogradskya consettensis]|uniref:Uncharacterized protein n=1 Tax=Winogradskya consettensis TaxID=113560 RepID=A0A919SCH2_9ACTN|nr:hypothetical protein Aco04nite_10960 [Actinoplanes consettensis]
MTMSAAGQDVTRRLGILTAATPRGAISCLALVRAMPPERVPADPRNRPERLGQSRTDVETRAARRRPPSLGSGAAAFVVVRTGGST